MSKKIMSFIGLFFTVCFAFSQIEIKGTIKDSNNLPLPGANVVEKGTTNGVATDFDGNFSLTVNENAVLLVTFTGFESKEVAVNGQTTIAIILSEGAQLEEIVITGSRTPPRSNTTSPLPVDIVASKELEATGQTTLDKALQYKVPSFNTVQTPVNDATSLLDPYEIRNMGPSRTLILINGKRKNLSSLLYTQTSPGRGETGADISGIPTEAIKSIQILRDGASAQYGSDAIAGVMNIILKDDYITSSATFKTGITSEGDGESIGVTYNGGRGFENKKGFINYTIDMSKSEPANRPGTVDADGEYNDFVYLDPESYSSYVNDDNSLGGVDISDFSEDEIETYFNDSYVGTTDYNSKFAAINLGNIAGREVVDDFLERNPDANNINGTPETSAIKFVINGEIETSASKNMYFDAAYTYKKVNSFANYRTPYWRQQNDFFNPTDDSGTRAISGWREGNDMNYLSTLFPGSNPLTEGGYDGYLPTFEGDLNDYNATLGFTSVINGWNSDASITVGGNKQTYAVSNSHNRSELLDDDGNYLYRENSPIYFQPGGTSFNHVVANIDISKILSEQISFAFGSEFRSEFFTIIEGDLASYDGIGADSFAGNLPENSGSFSRYNIGGYVSAAFDATEDLLFEGTLRGENYSDFGTTFIGKLSSRYKFAEDKYTVRASISNGFRAPTLHQIYTQKSQYSFVAGEGIQVSGLINNVSAEARQLGVPSLDAEKSINFTVGFGAKPIQNLSITLDYYDILIDDRIVLGNEIETELGSISYFSNAIDTQTTGIDLVVGYKNIELGPGKLGLNLSGNYTIKNERTDDNGDLDGLIDDTLESLLFTSRPKTKWILGANYAINKFEFNLGNTYFGKTEFNQAGLDENLKTEFIPKIVTDLGITFNATEKITINGNINNIFNILPEWEFVAENAAGEAILADEDLTQTQSNLITFNQRYSQMTYDGYHFSQLGTLFNLSVNYSF